MKCCQWSVVSCQWSVVSCQWSVVSGQLSVVSGQWSVVSGQWSVVSCQWSVVSCQWSVVSGQLSRKFLLCPSSLAPLLTQNSVGAGLAVKKAPKHNNHQQNPPLQLKTFPSKKAPIFFLVSSFDF
ncbi:hypothetical protein LAY57_21105 [Argonema antarcticum A004/B2]|nr:hypothetical protein [Argonema antarcticum A004/B2]